MKKIALLVFFCLAAGFTAADARTPHLKAGFSDAEASAARYGQVVNKGAGEFIIISQGYTEKEALNKALKAAELTAKERGYKDFIVKDQKVEYKGALQNEGQQRVVNTGLKIADRLGGSRESTAAGTAHQSLNENSYTAELAIVLDNPCAVETKSEESNTFPGFYIGIRIGSGGTNNFNDVYNPKVVSIEDPKDVSGLEIGYELPIYKLDSSYDESSKGLVGIRVGFEGYNSNFLNVEDGFSRTNYAFHSVVIIPVTLYYKYFFGESRFSMTGGFGVSFINASVYDTVVEEETSTSSGHVLIGLEYRLFRFFSLGVDLKATPASEVKCGPYKRDFCYQVAAAIRFYIF